MATSIYHKPVMLNECMEALNIKPNGKYVDVTFGGGGHSKEILSRLDKNGKLYAFDQDKDAAQNVPADDRLIFSYSNFREIRRFLKYYDTDVSNGSNGYDGILADLGISSYQIDTAERGFSIRWEGNLDMRMNAQSEITAADIVNSYSQEKLQKVFSEFGEVRNSKTLAEKIINERTTSPFSTTTEFISRIESCIRGNRLRYLAQVFQALRMEVNQELQSLEELLKQSPDVLNKGGRMVVLTYHSLEDRMVKNFFKTGNISGEEEKDFFGNTNRPFTLVNKKPITASENEVRENPRARSAKLRVAIKN